MACSEYVYRSPRGGDLDRRLVESAAQRSDEVDRERELTRAQVGIEALLREQRRFGAQDLQIIADSFAVAQDRQVVRLARGRQRQLLLRALFVDAAKRRELIDDV